MAHNAVCCWHSNLVWWRHSAVHRLCSIYTVYVNAKRTASFDLTAYICVSHSQSIMGAWCVLVSSFAPSHVSIRTSRTFQQAPYNRPATLFCRRRATVIAIDAIVLAFAVFCRTYCVVENTQKINTK